MQRKPKKHYTHLFLFLGVPALVLGHPLNVFALPAKGNAASIQPTQLYNNATSGWTDFLGNRAVGSALLLLLSVCLALVVIQYLISMLKVLKATRPELEEDNQNQELFGEDYSDANVEELAPAVAYAGSPARPATSTMPDSIFSTPVANRSPGGDTKIFSVNPKNKKVGYQNIILPGQELSGPYPANTQQQNGFAAPASNQTMPRNNPPEFEAEMQGFSHPFAAPAGSSLHTPLPGAPPVRQRTPHYSAHTGRPSRMRFTPPGGQDIDAADD